MSVCESLRNVQLGKYSRTIGSGCFHSCKSCSPCVNRRSAASRLSCKPKRIRSIGDRLFGSIQREMRLNATYNVPISLKLSSDSPRLQHNLGCDTRFKSLANPSLLHRLLTLAYHCCLLPDQSKHVLRACLYSCIARCRCGLRLYMISSILFSWAAIWKPDRSR